MTVATLRPTGLTAISLIPTGAPSSEDYVIDLGSLNLNEPARLEIAYSEGANVDGGEAISSHGPLVPVTFDVVVHGSGVSEDAAKQQMIQYVQALELAVCNPDGGTFEYKPTGLGAGVRSTYYHYIQSAPPKVRAKKGNNWDAAPVETAPSYVCAIELEIELQTQPFATSDPAVPVAVKTATTVYNQDDSVVGSITIAAADVKGTIGALTQLRIRNLVAGASAAIKKLWYARRTKPVLANFAPVLEGGTADTTSSLWWSTESDNARRSDNYQKYAPPEAANDQWATLSYTIANSSDHAGKASVAVVCRSLADSALDWDLKASLEVADLVVETGVTSVAEIGAWTVCVLGDLDIPPTPISADESYSLTLKIHLRRNAGDGPIDIDFVQLLYVDEYPQQVTIADGFTDSYRLLLENFVKELCHVVNQSTLAFDRVAEPLCQLLQLKPATVNRLDFIWERAGRQVLDDGFEDYEAWRWLGVADFETDETWDAGTADTVRYVEGAQGRNLSTTGDTSATLAKEMDLSIEGRFTTNDFVYLAVYVEDLAAWSGDTFFYIHFRTDAANYYRLSFYSGDPIVLGEGWNYLFVKKSDFIAQGAPDWSDINSLKIGIEQGGGGGFNCTFDDWRISKADPDAATKGNDTGAVWDFIRDVWHIEEQDSTDHALGCLDITAALEQVALIHEEPSANIKLLAKVRAKRDDGDVGLVFRCEDVTVGSEDMAAFFIDTANDVLELRKWAAGTASDIATAVAQVTAPDTNYWLGVSVLASNMVRCYFGTSKAAIWNEQTKDFVATAQVFDVTDSVFASGGALPTGQSGVLSIGTLGRFDDVELYSVADGHVPGDTVQVEAKAIFRTIYPFRE